MNKSMVKRAMQCVYPQTYRDHVLALGAVYYASFAEPPGATALVRERGATNLTIAGGGVAGSPGMLLDRAVLLDGTNDAISTDAAVNLTAYTAVTATILFYVTDFASTTLRPLIQHGPLVTTNGSWLYSVDGGVAAVTAVGIQYVRGDTLQNYNSLPRPTAGTWHHAAMVCDLSQAAGIDEASVYIDGELQTKAAPQSNVTNNGGAFGNLTQYIGSYGGGTYFFKGSVQHYAVIPRVLLQTEIRKLARTALAGRT